MKKFLPFGRLVAHLNGIAQSGREIREGIANQSMLLNERLSEIIAGLDNEQRIINDKLSELIHNFTNFHTDSNKRQAEIKEHLAAIATSLNKDFSSGSTRQQKSFESKLNEISHALSGLTGTLEIQQTAIGSHTRFTKPGADEAMRSMPLLRAPKTYNTQHPDYDPALARNFPGVLLNGDKTSANPALRAVRQVIEASEINDRAWPDQLEMALAELKSIPGSEQLLGRKAAAEHYFLDLNNRYQPHYQPGWMTLEDGLFLYWLIRRLRPKTVIETGVANGFSTSLILLAMAKNGNDGKLHAVGRAEIFDAGDPRWTEKGRIFGEVVVDGKSLGWMVPDECLGAVEFYEGDAKTLLPDVISRLDSLDLFFHDSDHSYDHMTFEFEEAKRKLSPSGVIVADNIAWNSSLWDFADKYGVPAYNFRGSVGAAFFG